MSYFFPAVRQHQSALSLILQSLFSAVNPSEVASSKQQRGILSGEINRVHIFRSVLTLIPLEHKYIFVLLRWLLKLSIFLLLTEVPLLDLYFFLL